MAFHARTFPARFWQAPVSAERQLKPSPPEKLGPYYFFEARIKVDKEDWEDFEDAGKPAQIVTLLEDVGLKLRHAATFRDDDSYFFYNYWELGWNANALADAELALADNALWAEFTKLIQRQEEKDLIFPVTPTIQSDSSGFDFSDLEKTRYLRIEYQLEHFALAEVDARLEAHVPSAGRENGWFLGASYLHLTGREGSLVQIWLVPATLTRREAGRLVAALPWLAPSADGTPLFKAPPTWGMLARSSFDPDPKKAADWFTTAMNDLSAQKSERAAPAKPPTGLPASGNNVRAREWPSQSPSRPERPG